LAKLTRLAGSDFGKSEFRRVIKPSPKYWKMRAFNYKLSSKQITIERVLGMIVRWFGILWRPIQYDVNKVPTIFHVLCKLHNICMDCWLLSNPTDARLHRLSSAEAIPFSNDDYLWSTFDVSVGLGDSFGLPSDDEIIGHLENRYQKLNDRRSYYTSRNISKREALMEEMYTLGVRFNREHEMY
jgi:hypothetical protein